MFEVGRAEDVRIRRADFAVDDYQFSVDLWGLER